MTGVHLKFRALGDPTRQRIVEWLATGETPTATEVAERLPITRQGVARHMKILVTSGLVEGSRSGREKRYSLNAESLGEAEEWITRRARSWERALARLEAHLNDAGPCRR